MAFEYEQIVIIKGKNGGEHAWRFTLYIIILIPNSQYRYPISADIVEKIYVRLKLECTTLGSWYTSRMGTSRI